MWIGRMLLLGLVASAAQASWPESVTLANGEWPPYQSRNLPHCGKTSQVVEEAFAAEGIRVEYQFFPWKRAYEMARDGTLDGTLVWARTPEREADFLYSDPVMSTHFVLFHSSTKAIVWQTLADLAPYRLGGVLGYTYGEEFSRLQAAGTLKLELATSDDVNLRKLAVRHIDASPMDRDVGLYFLGTSLRDLAPQLTYDSKEIGTAPHHVLISRRSPHGAELIKAFNAGLAKLRSSGRLAELDALPPAK